MSTTLSPATLFILLISVTFTLAISSCRDDDAQPNITEYDPAVHVYTANFRSRVGEWETFLDITTGNYDSIPGTRNPAGSINFPSGTAVLTDFIGNRRIYITIGSPNALIVQDLFTLEKTTIPLELADGTRLVTRPEFLTFGSDNNTVFVFDTADETLYRADLVSETLAIAIDEVDVDRNALEALLYLKSTQELLFLGSNYYTIYDLTSGQIVTDNGTLPNLFGFAKHPTTEEVYALTIPNASRVFRLVRLNRQGDEFAPLTLSANDLAIDQISRNIQTIHTATNAFVCRGGSTQENSTENFVYSIDLNTGDLIRTVTLDGFEIMTKLAGE